MKRLEIILRLIFPYRTHLEQEVEYLKAQLAQNQRRVDEMRELVSNWASKIAEKKPREPLIEPMNPVKPTGFGEYKQKLRSQGDGEGSAQQAKEVVAKESA